jgi:hypothetical protein
LILCVFPFAAIQVSPIRAVGNRGVYGTILGTALCGLAHFSPGNDAEGALENFVDTFDMIKNSQFLFIFVIALTMLVIPQQLFHEMLQVRNHNELTRLLWGAFLPGICWAGSLCLWSITHGWYLGEPWQPALLAGYLLGFACLLLGTIFFFAELVDGQCEWFASWWRAPLSWWRKAGLCCLCCFTCGRTSLDAREEKALDEVTDWEEGRSDDERLDGQDDEVGELGHAEFSSLRNAR